MTDLEIYIAVIEHPNLEFSKTYMGGGICCTNVWCDNCPLCIINEETKEYQYNCRINRISPIIANLSAFEFQYKASQ